MVLENEVGTCVKCIFSLLTSRTGMPVVSKLLPEVPELVPAEEMVPLGLVEIVRKLVLESADTD